MNKLILISSAIILLIVSSILGFLGKPTEMGLAILAGALGMAFSNIDKISKFKGAGFEAEMHDKLEAIVDKETEEETDAPVYSPLDSSLKNAPSKTRSVIHALQNDKYTWRSITGLRKDTGLSRKELSECIGWAVTNNYARHSLGKSGSVWALTAEGRGLSAQIDSEGV